MPAIHNQQKSPEMNLSRGRWVPYRGRRYRTGSGKRWDLFLETNGLSRQHRFRVTLAAAPEGCCPRLVTRANIGPRPLLERHGSEIGLIAMIRAAVWKI
jgi:hypothetical protein